MARDNGAASEKACPLCAADLDHCHGTLIVHHDLVMECTDAGCTALDRVRHALVVECGEIVPPCGCGDVAAPGT
ncbi:hypothetical protein [Tomitella gaofuii]|uniref:hypothetical protein n=1 Tax=Tomitella gaofuii TaxID=2760083 RepID=UPI0015F83D6A|nr:hypothetical protein [Tomitella gaofuii]